MMLSRSCERDHVNISFWWILVIDGLRYRFWTEILVISDSKHNGSDASARRSVWTSVKCKRMWAAAKCLEMKLWLFMTARVRTVLITPIVCGIMPIPAYNDAIKLQKQIRASVRSVCDWPRFEMQADGFIPAEPRSSLNSFLSLSLIRNHNA